jgi:hypothetical protein
MAAPTPRPARSRTIPANLHAATLARLRETDPDTGRPHTCASVAKWLDEAHGCPASRLAVQRLRATVEKHTSAQVTAALREEIAEAVPAILARVQRSTKRLDAAAARSTSTKDLAAATNALTRALHELATLGGVAAPQQLDLTSGGKPLDDVHDRLLARLARFAQEPDVGGPRAVGPDTPEAGG